ncbi:MAG TPA: hypothetical protein VF125_05685 [Solirubrobacterales bacterium]
MEPVDILPATPVLVQLNLNPVIVSTHPVYVSDVVPVDVVLVREALPWTATAGDSFSIVGPDLERTARHGADTGCGTVFAIGGGFPRRCQGRQGRQRQRGERPAREEHQLLSHDSAFLLAGRQR